MKKFKEFIKKHANKFFIGYIVLMCSLFLFLFVYESYKKNDNIAFAYVPTISYPPNAPFNELGGGVFYVLGIQETPPAYTSTIGYFRSAYSEEQGYNLLVSPRSFATSLTFEFFGYVQQNQLGIGTYDVFYLEKNNFLMSENFWFNLFYFEAVEVGAGQSFVIKLDMSYLTNNNTYNTVSRSIVFNSSNPVIDSFAYMIDLSDAYRLSSSIGNNEEFFVVQNFSLSVDYNITAPQPEDLSFYLYIDYNEDLLFYDWFSFQKTPIVINDTDINIVASLFNTVNDFLKIEILPDFSFSDLLLIALCIPLTVWLLKAWLGG